MKLVHYSYARKTFTRLLTVLTASRPSNCKSCGEGLLLTPKYSFSKPLVGYAANICQPLTVVTSHGVWSCPRRSFSSVRTNLQENSKPRVSPQEEIVSSVVEQDKPLTCDEWDSVRNEVLSARGPFNANSIDAFIMHSCCKESRFQVGLSFIKYLQQQQGKGPNVATVGLFMKLFNQCFWDRKVDPELSALVLSLYDSMRQKCPLLDCSTAERAIQGLSLTSRWKEGYELLEMAKLTDWPRSAAYTALACAAFNNGEGEKGWQVLAELFQRVDRKPGQEAYLTWLKNGGSVFTVLEFLAEHGQVISAEVAEQLRRSAESTKQWRGKMAVISDSGVCSSCRSQVTSPNLTEEEFGRLKSAILDRVLIGDNVYLKTTPTEVKSFLNFLSRCQKYDIVLDGLNIAMAATNSSARTSPSALSALLKDTVYHFTRRGLRVLVLGRKHMGKWNRKHMDLIMRNAQMFLAENLTQDDPLLLLAAINSGLGTKIVSRDLLRSHTFLLKEPDLQRLFRRWQYNHQCTYFIKNGKISIVDPPQLCPEVQKSSETSWHVPYEEKMVVLPPSLPLKVPDNWLCLVKNKIK